MNTPNDVHLRQLLRRSWTVAASPDPRFRAAVWARIEAGRRLPSTWGGWLRLNLARVATYATVGIALAGAGGGLLGARQTEHEREKSLQRYVMSIDPHQRTTPQDGP